MGLATGNHNKITPERWQQVKELFESALERAPDERAAFLDHACDGDETLRSEIKSLLASYEEGESFMERPAVALAAETLAGPQAESLVGQTIRHYQVTRLIGNGGMGEVYLAQDAKLGRPGAQSARSRILGLLGGGGRGHLLRQRGVEAASFFSFATRQVRQIAVMEKEAAQWDPGFAISPDGRWILYMQVDQDDSDIMLVDNFQ